MPLYTYKCNTCENEQDAIRKIAEMHDTPDCEECGSETRKIIVPVNIGAYSTKVMEPFESPATGKVITTERQKKADMEESGCRPWEGLEQERKENKRKSEYSKAKLDKAVDENLQKQIAKMPSEKRKRLGL